MRFLCQATQLGTDSWQVRYADTDLGPVTVTAPTREQALEKMQRELRYRLELCPCTGKMYEDVRIELHES
jgi:hypothetical protein